jgi:hypothetical protein
MFSLRCLRPSASPRRKGAEIIKTVDIVRRELFLDAETQRCGDKRREDTYKCFLCVASAPQRLRVEKRPRSTPSLQIQALLTDLINLRFRRQRQLRDGQAEIAQAAGFRQNRVRLAVHLL